MVVFAILSADTALCRSFEKLLRDEQSAAFLSAVDHTTALSKLAEKHGIDVILVHAPLIVQFADWRAAGNETAWTAIFDDIDEERSLTAIKLGASAILSNASSHGSNGNAESSCAGSFIQRTSSASSSSPASLSCSDDFEIGSTQKSFLDQHRWRFGSSTLKSSRMEYSVD